MLCYHLETPSHTLLDCVHVTVQSSIWLPNCTRLIKVIWNFRKFLKTFQNDMNMKQYTPSMKFHCRFTTELCQCEGYAQGHQKYEGYSGERSMQKSGEAEVHSH